MRYKTITSHVAFIMLLLVLITFTPCKAQAVTWTQLNQDGFGNPDNTDFRGLCTFNDSIYAATRNFTTGTQVWNYDGSDWTQVNEDGFGNPCNIATWSMRPCQHGLCLGTVNNATGCELWSYDGDTWTQRASGGFADQNNTMAASMAEFDSFGYIGTSNAVTGTEVWKLGSGKQQVNSDGFGDVNNIHT